MNVNLHVDFKYDAALLCACDTESRGYDGVEMAELLLDAGADIEIRDEYDNTPLIEALYSDNAPPSSPNLQHLAITRTEITEYHRIILSILEKNRRETPDLLIEDGSF